MFVIPEEHVLFTSQQELSLQSNRCYKIFNEVTKDYIAKHMIMNRLLPRDLSRLVMNNLDPRRDIHKFTNCSGKVYRGSRYIIYNLCGRCFLKICSGPSKRIPDSTESSLPL